jgi:ECF transporter S component (folate family)
MYNNVKNIFKRSALELKDVRCITTVGVLIAMSVVLEMFNVRTPMYKINFAFLPMAVIGLAYGPAVCILAEIPADILGAVLAPDGSINFVYTGIAMFEGLVYGMFLYGKHFDKDAKNHLSILSAQACVALFAHIIFNSIAMLAFGYAKPSSVIVFLCARAVKNLIQYPFDIALLIVVLVPVSAVFRSRNSVKSLHNQGEK